jgi:hypothetical protein
MPLNSLVRKSLILFEVFLFIEYFSRWILQINYRIPRKRRQILDHENQWNESCFEIKEKSILI